MVFTENHIYQTLFDKLFWMKLQNYIFYWFTILKWKDYWNHHRFLYKKFIYHFYVYIIEILVIWGVLFPCICWRWSRSFTLAHLYMSNFCRQTKSLIQWTGRHLNSSLFYYYLKITCFYEKQYIAETFAKLIKSNIFLEKML